MKATGVIEASPSTILKLFEDNSRVAEYNKFYAEGRDLEDINDSTKVRRMEGRRGREKGGTQGG